MTENEKEYFYLALELFYEAQWLYRFPVTELLVRSCLDEFPSGWNLALRDLDTLELNQLVVNKLTKRDWPQSLLSFVEKCFNLDKLPPIAVDHDPEIMPQSFRTGLSKKKQHEILRLAKLVKSQCENANIKTIVDLGAGLGYVCQLLNFLYDYKVVGLDSNPKNVETAKLRQNKFYSSSIGRVHYLCTRIDADSSTQITNCLKNFTNNVDENFCLIGLHTCADLGVDACKLFSSISTAKILVLQSCCYHKMEIQIGEDETRERFKNFPVSQTLRDIFESSDRNYYEIFQRPFFRLACQESAVRWTEMSEDAHREHAFHVLARALLESFVRENSIKLKKRVRKATRKSQCADFKTYLEDAMLRYEFGCDDKSSIKDDEIRETLLSAWEKIDGSLVETEIYTGLQLLLQSPAESLILKDRVCWLLEMGYETEIIPVTSRNLSPRSHAIVSIKRTQ